MKYRVLVIEEALSDEDKRICGKKFENLDAYSSTKADFVEDNVPFCGGLGVWFQTEYDFSPQVGWTFYGRDLFPEDIPDCILEEPLRIICIDILSREVIVVNCDYGLKNELEILEEKTR
jgi:hypothetical protein